MVKDPKEMTMALQEWMRSRDEGLFAAFRDPAVPANFKLQPLQILRLLLGGLSQ